MKVEYYLVPDDLLYTKEHEWARISGNKALVGITDYGAKMLNDVVYVSLPAPGSAVRQMEVMGSVESIKAISDVYSPLAGKIIKTNEELKQKPELVNLSPYGDGWLVEMEIKLEDKGNLLSALEYAKHIEGLISENR